jgi:hypothetical protein
MLQRNISLYLHFREPVRAPFFLSQLTLYSEERG